MYIFDKDVTVKLPLIINNSLIKMALNAVIVDLNITNRMFM